MEKGNFKKIKGNEKGKKKTTQSSKGEKKAKKKGITKYLKNPKFKLKIRIT